MKLGMWVEVDSSIIHVICCCWWAYFKYLICILFWLANNKNANIQSSVWAAVKKLGMLVVVGTDITHVVRRQQICIFNISFAYLFWLANNKKGKYPEFYMGYSDKTWYVGSGGHK